MANVSRIVRTPTVRLSFPNLLAPRAYKDLTKGITGQPRFSADFLMEPADLDKFKVMQTDEATGVESFVTKNLKVILADAARERWGADYDLKGAIQHGGLKWPIKDGDKIAEKRAAQNKKGADVTTGKVVISAASKDEYAPQLYVLEAGKLVELDRKNDKERIGKLFVGGMYVAAGLKLVPNETPQGRFLNLYLNTVLYVKAGPRIGGIDAATIFADIEEAESDFDPTGAAIAL